MKEFIRRLGHGETFSQNQRLEALSRILQGATPESDIADFLTGLSARGETADEIAGAARVLRSMADTINAPPRRGRLLRHRRRPE